MGVRIGSLPIDESERDCGERGREKALQVSRNGCGKEDRLGLVREGDSFVILLKGEGAQGICILHFRGSESSGFTLQSINEKEKAFLCIAWIGLLSVGPGPNCKGNNTAQELAYHTSALPLFFLFIFFFYVGVWDFVRSSFLTRAILLCYILHIYRPIITSRSNFKITIIFSDFPYPIRYLHYGAGVCLVFLVLLIGWLNFEILKRYFIKISSQRITNVRIMLKE